MRSRIMFRWNEFTELARECASAFCANDERLTLILAASAPLSERTDDIGKPLPESVSINEHPDPANFKRALGIRRDIAKGKGQSHYVAYSDSVLSFLNGIPQNDPLFVVLIATAGRTYEFLYTPITRAMKVSEVAS
jgi:hypothetical protein